MTTVHIPTIPPNPTFLILSHSFQFTMPTLLPAYSAHTNNTTQPSSPYPGTFISVYDAHPLASIQCTFQQYHPSLFFLSCDLHFSSYQLRKNASNIFLISPNCTASFWLKFHQLKTTEKKKTFIKFLFTLQFCYFSLDNKILSLLTLNSFIFPSFFTLLLIFLLIS